MQQNFVSRSNVACQNSVDNVYQNLAPNQSSNYTPINQVSQSYTHVAPNLYNCANTYVPPPAIGTARPNARQTRPRAIYRAVDIRTSRAQVVMHTPRAPTQTLNTSRASAVPSIPIRAAVPPATRPTLPSPTPITAATNASATTQAVNSNTIRATDIVTAQAPSVTTIQNNRTVANINAITSAKTTPTTPVSATPPTQQPSVGATPASVTSTTRPPSTAPLTGSEQVPLRQVETCNKACQVKMDQVTMVTKSMNTSIPTSDAECQTDFETKKTEVKTYVDKASSPIPISMFAKQKQTPKRRKLNSPVEPEENSDEEVDVMD